MFFTSTVRIAEGRAPLGPLEGALILDALQSMRREQLAKLHAFAILPEQVAILLSALEEKALDRALQIWERFAARQIGQLRHERGTLWASERVVAPISAANAQSALEEILALPVKSGLAPSAASYSLCSAHANRTSRVDPLP